MGEIFERRRPDKPFEWTGERLTTAVEGQVEIEHLHRYFLARELVRGLDVLDVASGEGYGSALLAQVARSVIGVELAEPAVRHATTNYLMSNLRFMEGDARALPLDDASVDAVVSFETIEHFYEQAMFLREVKRVLRPGGVLLLSSPDRDTYSPPSSDANPFHARELSRAEFVALLDASFEHVRMLYQRPMLGSVLLSEPGAKTGEAQHITFERRGADHYEASAGVSRPLYLVALASDAVLAPVPDSIFVETSEIGRVLSRARQHEALAASAAGRVEAEAALADAQARVLQLEADAVEFRLERAEAHGEINESVRQAIAAAQSGAEVEIAAMRQAVQSACGQRDMARMSLRRVAASADHSWRSRLAAQERMAAEDTRQLVATYDARHQAIEEARERAAQDALYWRARYDGLRLRLEGILRRFGVVWMARLFPQRVRLVVRQRLLGR